MSTSIWGWFTDGVAAVDAWGANLIGELPWLVVWTIAMILIIAFPIIICVAFLTLWERRLIGYMHIRRGPNRVGPGGILQPFADVLKLLTKEVIVPARANKVLYLLSPIMTLVPALAAWAVVPFGPDAVLANVNAGMLFIVAITSLEVYGVIFAGWSSNSKYPFLGAMRASAQMISYELALTMILVTILLVSGTFNMNGIIMQQNQGFFADMGLNFLSWNWLALFPLFIVYIISIVAECNRHPFDVVEGEAEIVAGHMVEYSGMGFAMFFLAEYANMILLSALASIFFLGGWATPIDIAPFNWIPGWIWLGLKTFCVVSLYVWFRASFPRFRYDQIMRLGWKVFIPVTFAWFLVVAIWKQTPFSIW